MTLALSSRKVALLVGLAVLIGILSLGVFPLREYLDQRAALGEANASLFELREQNADYEQRIVSLGSDDTIEHLARSEYNLVYPDEEAYTILPLPDFDRVVPEPWPFSEH